jgi:hypothetical protein
MPPPAEPETPRGKIGAAPTVRAASGPALMLLGAAVLACSMWFFVARVWAPPLQSHFSDLYPRWYGSRALLVDHRDPYSPAVTSEIQTLAYGRAVHPGESRDEERFAYPLYIALLLAPTVGLPFARVASVFLFVLPVLAVLSVLLWVAMLGWRCPKATLGSLVLLSLGSFPMLESIYLEQPALLAAALLAGAGAALASGRMGLAGTLLALATIKPQLTAPLVIWLLVWACWEWRSRNRLVWGFALTMLVLAGVSELLLPGWGAEFLAGLAAYQQYTGNFSILTLLFSNLGTAIAGVGLAGALAVVAWQMRHESAGSDRFNYGFVMVLTVTVVAMPTLYPTGQVVLLPAIFLLLEHRHRVWASGRARRLGLVAVSSLIAWPWVGSLAYLLASLAVPLSSLRRLWIVPVASILLIPIALLIMLASLAPTALGVIPPAQVFSDNA